MQCGYQGIAMQLIRYCTWLLGGSIQLLRQYEYFLTHCYAVARVLWGVSMALLR